MRALLDINVLLALLDHGFNASTLTSVRSVGGD